MSDTVPRSYEPGDVRYEYALIDGDGKNEAPPGCGKAQLVELIDYMKGGHLAGMIQAADAEQRAEANPAAGEAVGNFARLELARERARVADMKPYRRPIGAWELVDLGAPE